MVKGTLGSRVIAMRSDPLPWIVVRHLLDAEALRDLCEAIVAFGSDAALALSDLFEQTSPFGPQPLANWFVRPRWFDAPVAGHLTRTIMSIVWQNDDANSPPRDGLTSEEAKRLEALSAALTLSTADLGHIPDRMVHETSGDSLFPLRSALHVLGGHLGDMSAAIAKEAAAAACAGRDDVLAALLTKHLGDLCADADQWTAADALYSDARLLLGRPAPSDWTPVVKAARAIVQQSEAMAVWYLRGPDEASDLLDTILSGHGVDTAPLNVVNASFDALTARLASGDFLAEGADRRVAALFAPLLLHTHNVADAYSASVAGKHAEASRRFWSVLRRQTALGGATQARFTKAHFGQAILIELEEGIERQHRAGDFLLAVRLLIESGDERFASRVRWTTELVASYLTPAVLEYVEAVAERAPGVRIPRRLVAVALYRAWVGLVPADRLDLAEPMLLKLMSTAAKGGHSGNRSTSSGGQALKALRELGEARPEFQFLAGRAVLAVLDDVLRAWGPLPLAEALEMAASFIDGADEDVVRMLATRTIEIVDRLPRSAFFPITNAATNLLSSGAISKLAKKDAAFRLERDRTLIRLALNSPEEQSSLLWLLSWVDPLAISEQVDDDQIQAIVENTKARAAEIRSSDAGSHIQGLLLAPQVVGAEGVKVALCSLEQIIRTASERRPSPALANASIPLRLLGREMDRVRDNGKLEPSWFDARLARLLEAVESLWIEAAERPLILSGFAIPPSTKPNPTVVHNWAFASLEFASALGQSEQMGAAMNMARSNEQLTNAIASGVAAGVGADHPALLEVAAVSTEPADAFYAVLGQRLLASEDAPERGKVLRAMTNRCLLVGPRGEDAGVFLAARREGLLFDAESTPVVSYKAKLLRDRKLRLSLSSLLNSIIGEMQ